MTHSHTASLTLSAAARAELDAYFAGREKSALRIYAAPGGCSGKRLALAPGEPEPGDILFAEQGHRFCIAPELSARTAALCIDLSHTGFSVTSGAPPGGEGCSSCAGCDPAG